MFSMCSELTPRARIPDTRIPQFMQPWLVPVKVMLAKNVSFKGPHLMYNFYLNQYSEQLWAIVEVREWFPSQQRKGLKYSLVRMMVRLWHYDIDDNHNDEEMIDDNENAI